MPFLVFRIKKQHLQEREYYVIINYSPSERLFKEQQGSFVLLITETDFTYRMEGEMCPRTIKTIASLLCWTDC